MLGALVDEIAELEGESVEDCDDANMLDILAVVLEVSGSPLQRLAFEALERSYSPSSCARSRASWASSDSEYGGDGQHGSSEPTRSEQWGRPSIWQTRR